MIPRLLNRVQKTSTWILFLGLGAGWILYALLGHRLIDLAYKGEAVSFLNDVMQGRAGTPIEAYYKRADELMVLGTIWLVIPYCALMLFLKRPLGALLATFSFFCASFLLFCFFELFPSLLQPFHLGSFIAYYGNRANFIYDDALAAREKPFNRAKAYNFRGDHYSPLYGIEVPPLTIDWRTDENGFRNSITRRFSDIVVIGDSYVEWGPDEADTFVKRLENQLSGLTVTNLGKSGYGPFQYLEVLKRFGLKYKPQYALLGFYEGNDILDITNYLRWKGLLPGRTPKNGMYEPPPSSSLLVRYSEVLTEIIAHMGDATWLAVQLGLNRFAQTHGYSESIHPDIALLKLGKDKYYKILLYHRNDPQPPDEILRTDEWHELTKILTDFKSICVKNQIVPIILYFPSAAHIYAPYSTQQSGRNWLQIRDEQIAARNNMEKAMTHLSHELHLDLIDVSPIFDHAAKEGKLLYYPLDTHWNSEGKELAAAFVADTMKSRYLAPAHKLN